MMDLPLDIQATVSLNDGDTPGDNIILIQAMADKFTKAFRLIQRPNYTLSVACVTACLLRIETPIAVCFGLHPGLCLQTKDHSDIQTYGIWVDGGAVVFKDGSAIELVFHNH